MQVRPQRFFGASRVWVGDVRVRVTDLERTLLDGLNKPRYCGDFGEVLHAFQLGTERLDVERVRLAIECGDIQASGMGTGTKWDQWARGRRTV